MWSKGKVPSNMTMSNTPPAHTSTSFPSYPIGFPSPPVGWLRLFMSSGDMYTGVLQQQAHLKRSQTQHRCHISFITCMHAGAGPKSISHSMAVQPSPRCTVKVGLQALIKHAASKAMLSW